MNGRIADTETAGQETRPRKSGRTGMMKRAKIRVYFTCMPTIWQLMIFGLFYRIHTGHIVSRL